MQVRGVLATSDSKVQVYDYVNLHERLRNITTVEVEVKTPPVDRRLCYGEGSGSGTISVSPSTSVTSVSSVTVSGEVVPSAGDAGTRTSM